MATKLIIVYPMRDSSRMPPMGRFRRIEKYDAHIWDGRDFDTSSEEDMKAFNEQVLPALTLLDDRLPKTIVKAVYEASIEAFTEEAHPIPHEASMPRKRHARMKPGLVPA